MHRKYRKLVSAGLVLTMAGAMTLQGCGQKEKTGNFCMNCGARKPQQKAASYTWNCECGAKGNTGKFCPNCGAKRPEINTGWDCSCGQKNNTGKFCANCGKKWEE